MAISPRGKLYRARRGRWIAGIARGQAEWSGLPVAIVRLLWFLALLPGGVPGIVIDLVFWIFTPKQPG